MILAFEGRSPHIADSAFVAPGAVLIGDVRLGDHSSVWFNAVLRADQNTISVGTGSNIQDGVVVHCDRPEHPGFPVLIGRNVTIGHGSVIHGCTIGNGALIGSGSVILDGAVIGARTLVAAGSVVLPGTEFPDEVLVAGSPARVRRELTGPELVTFAQPHQIYQQLSDGHADALAAQSREGVG